MVTNRKTEGMEACLDKSISETVQSNIKKFEADYFGCKVECLQSLHFFRLASIVAFNFNFEQNIFVHIRIGIAIEASLMFPVFYRHLPVKNVIGIVMSEL